MGCAFVLVIFLGILLKWLCSKPSMKNWRKGCCPCGEAPPASTTPAVETQLMELKEMMKKQREVTVTPDASRLPVISGGIPSAPPSESGGKLTLEDMSHFKVLQKRVYKERVDIMDKELGGDVE